MLSLRTYFSSYRARTRLAFFLYCSLFNTRLFISHYFIINMIITFTIRSELNINSLILQPFQWVIINIRILTRLMIWHELRHMKDRMQFHMFRQFQFHSNIIDFIYDFIWTNIIAIKFESKAPSLVIEVSDTSIQPNPLTNLEVNMSPLALLLLDHEILSSLQGSLDLAIHLGNSPSTRLCIILCLDHPACCGDRLSSINSKVW